MALEDYLVRADNRKNPCGDCQLHIAACPWLCKDHPVPGWTAKRVPWRGQGGKWSITYAISDCPLHVPPSKKRLKMIKKSGPEYRGARTFY